MKKLMTMLSAVAVAFGLQAASPYPSGSHFNDENWMEIESETNLWTSLEGLSISTNPASLPAGVSAPLQFFDSDFKNNLEFQRGLTDPTYRAIRLDASTKQPLTQNLTSTGVVVDTLIKFTPYDEEDQASLDDTNAKIAVWVKEIEGGDGAASTYQLMVSAGKFDSESSTLTRTDYACSSKINDINAWYRLTVKAVADMSGGYQIPGFVVFLNGEAVSSAEVKKDVSSIDKLSSEATSWNVVGSIFPSLISSDQTIRQVGFAGKGWIDDLSFTDVIPEFAAATATFTIEGGAHVESFKYNGQTWTKGDAPLVCLSDGEAPKTVTNIVYAAGYFGPETETVDREANATNKIGEGAQLLAATVTIDGQSTPCGTLADAIAVVNAATADVTLKLGANSYDTTPVDIENTAGKVTTLDLAGCTISNALYALSKLIITDSSDKGTGKVDASIGGDVDGDDYMLTIEGGKFLASANSEGIAAKLPDGKALIEQDGYYVLGDKPAGPTIDPITPSASSTNSYESADAATNAAEEINKNPETYIQAPEAVTDADAKKAYAALFVATVVDGTKVVVDLKAEAATTIQQQVDIATTNLNVAAVAAAETAANQTITVTPGLYYSVKANSTLTKDMPVRSCELATGTTLSISLPKFTGAGFYQIQATVAPKTPVEE